MVGELDIVRVGVPTGCGSCCMGVAWVFGCCMRVAWALHGRAWAWPVHINTDGNFLGIRHSRGVSGCSPQRNAAGSFTNRTSLGHRRDIQEGAPDLGPCEYSVLRQQPQKEARHRMR